MCIHLHTLNIYIYIYVKNEKTGLTITCGSIQKITCGSKTTCKPITYGSKK